ncbi:ferrous iron transport protein A [Rhodobacter aestuarii]|uniref:Ferrous iron transport protein A n=1 Tax=Rhodobacter aestuarii TaxID=453582 RepID=A0A1N7QIF2_9RHOB|nr:MULTISPECIES: FeoA family protein [Rhodobacter]PTV93354.1 ferrous iron transport protein A [Rhodobacter aestuarii]SIT22287.1 ferrous iron transport protein A [Rhodobacter aestuarii]SOC13254.1 ferrous iron transport protein A [Rhodobacter sp. JA431]
MSVQLKDMAIGARGRVTGLRPGLGSYRKKLLSMGLTPGAVFTVQRVAPMGDPVEIALRGFRLTLRKAEADALIVELDTETGDAA